MAVRIVANLRGVGTRTATAILAALRPDRHTALDVRAYATPVANRLIDAGRDLEA